MKALLKLTPLFTALALATPALGQGADLCANAQPIAGLGVFNFDNSIATTDGTPDPLCLEFGLDSIELDVWFTWMAPTSGTFILNTCGQTTVDTKIGVYDASCAGAVLACNDDTCTLQSQVTWSGVAGQTYMFRIGCYPTNPVGGTGTFTITEDVPIFNPANGSYYQYVDAPGITWNQAMMDAANSSYMGLSGHLATITDQQENDFIYGLGDAHYRYIGGFQNTSSPQYAEPGGGWEWITGEPFVYSNWWLPNEPNNSGPSGAEDYLELLDGAQFGQAWNDTQNDHAHGYVVEFSGLGAGPGTAYCLGDGSGAPCPCGNLGGTGEGCANSGGTGATLTGSGGTGTGAGDTLVLDVTGVPGAKPGLLLRGDNQIAALIGGGLLCVGSNTQRSQVQVTDAGGATTFSDWNGSGFESIANSGAATHIQFWYRDPGGVPCAGTDFNFSNGYSVTYP